MTCIYKYNNKSYTAEEFKHLLLTNKVLAEKVMQATKERLISLHNKYVGNPSLREVGNIVHYDKFLEETGRKIEDPVDVEGFKIYRNTLTANKTFNDGDIYDINQAVLGMVLSSINLNDVLNKPLLIKKVTEQYYKMLNTLKEQGLNDEYGFMLENRDQILGRNGLFEGSALEHLSAEVGVDSLEEFLDLTGENIKDHGQSSFEVDITSTLSAKMKLLFASIPDTRAEKGFGGLTPLLGSSEALNLLQQALADINGNNLENLLSMLEAKANKNKVEAPIYNKMIDILKQLNKTDPDVLNQTLYNLYQAKVDMKFIMWGLDNKGAYTLMPYDANVKNPLFLKRNAWIENMKSNNLFEMYEGTFFKLKDSAVERINEYGKDLLDAYAKAAAKSQHPQNSNNFRKDVASFIDRKKLEDTLKYFGISLNEQTISNMYEGKNQADFDIMKMLVGGQNSIIGQYLETIKTIQEGVEKGLEYTIKSPVRSKDNMRKMNPMLYKNSQVNDLIKADNFVEFMPMGSMYIAGKTINMFQQHNPISNKMKDIRTSLQEYVKDLRNPDLPEEEKVPKGILADFLNSPLTKNSYLLNLIKDNPLEAAKYMDTFLISLEAIKEEGTSSRDDMGVTELSDADSIMTLLGMYGSSEGSFTDASFTKRTGLKLRKGLINFPTISDSSQLPFLKTILIELGKNDVKGLNEDNETLGKNVLALLREQLLEGDLNRITDYMLNVDPKDGTNMDGYDAGAVWITNMSALNYTMVDHFYDKTITDENGNETVVEDFQTKRSLIFKFREEVEALKVLKGEKSDAEIKSLADELVKNFIETHQEAIDATINEVIEEDVNKLVDKEAREGLFVEAGLVSEKKGLIKASTGSEGSDFYKEKGRMKPARLVAYDYVVNNFLQQKEIQTLFAGDLAFYFKNNMNSNLVNGLPEVSFEDILEAYYPDSKNDVLISLQGEKPSNLSDEQKNNLISSFPELLYSKEFLPEDVDYDEHHEHLLEASRIGVNAMFKKVQNNLSKRLKGQISPGSQLTTGVDVLKDYKQIMVNDVENGSETIMDLVSNFYPELVDNKDFIEKLNEFKDLDAVYNRSKIQEGRLKDLLKGTENSKGLEQYIPKIAAYLKTTSTDAQEYTSWRDNLNQLVLQGRITRPMAKIIENKLQNQAKDLEKDGVIQEHNLLTGEQLKVVMQPSKPLYSGMTKENINGHIVQRYVYIKSSSFPLIPELTAKFPKLDRLRRTVEKMEGKDTKYSVRVSYQSANKVGAVKSAINIEELYKDEPDMDLVAKSTAVLSRKNFYIQQDKPFKSDKNLEKGKQDRTTRATQFEKIILGDGISKMGSIFPAQAFDKALLDGLGIIPDANGNISGPNLKAIYNDIYKREQKILADQMFSELGINTYNDIAEGKPEAMQQLVKAANKRLSNKQDRKAMELLYLAVDPMTNTEKAYTAQELYQYGLTPTKAYFKIPLMLTPNSRKFESVFNSMVNKNSINLSLPGYSFPVASQEGFDFKGYSDKALEEAKKNGLILTKNFDPKKGLQATRDAKTGQLKHAQVFIANKFKYYDTKTRKQKYIDLKEFTDDKGLIDTAKLPEDLLSMFSFRIPTSAHQSGTIIEIAGFLPHTMGDLMIVPRDHTVQIGEDYDIDVRYAYQYNYIRTENGSLKKLDYNDLKALDTEHLPDLDAAREEYNAKRAELFDKYYEYRQERDNKDRKEGAMQLRNPIFEMNRQLIIEISILNTYLSKSKKAKNLIDEEYVEMVQGLLEGDETPEDALARLETALLNHGKTSKETSKKLRKEYKDLSKFLLDNLNEVEKAWKPYFNIQRQKGTELKVLENNLVSMYKSVFSSSDSEVQKLITSVLSTDFSESSASIIDDKLAKKDKHFSIYSPATQRKVMKLGADGKMGIGVHSNAVTMNSILQQLEEPIAFYKDVDEESNQYIPYRIQLGSNVFRGELGDLKTKSGNRTSNYLMESQNSSTDNQKLEIMGRRNENPQTISVFSFMQMSNLEDEGTIRLNGKDVPVSYASLFISQPVLIDFAKQVKARESSTNKNKSFNPTKDVIKDLREDLIEKIGKKSPIWARNKKGEILVGILDAVEAERIGKDLANSQSLYNSIGNDLKDPPSIDFVIQQFYVLENFNTFRGLSSELNKLQSFINIENGGIGTSYFDTIKLKDQIREIPNLQLAKASYVLGGKEAEKGSGFFQDMFGKMSYVNNEKVEEFRLANPDAVFINKVNDKLSLFVTPTNHYSHKIMNSISLGYNLWNPVFPYDNTHIQSQLYTILEQMGITPNSKRGIEMQYKIISQMKDYSYSSSRGLFNGKSLEAVRDNIFFDDISNQQESLASYLTRIKNSPTFKSLFDKPFFRDLQMDSSSPGYPSIIKYATSDVSKGNNLRVYNTLLKMIDSKSPLPSKLDGTPMNSEKLLKDLLTYSLLADQANGAIGFRHLLPLELFEKYNVDKVLRNRNSAEQDLSITYNGVLVALENFTGSTINDFNEGILPIQYEYDSNNNLVRSRTDQETIEFLATINGYYFMQTGQENAFSLSDDGDYISFNYYNGDSNIKSFFSKQYIQHNPDDLKVKFYYGTDNLSDLLHINGHRFEDLTDGYIDTIRVPSNLTGFYDYFVIYDKEDNPILFEKKQTVFAYKLDQAEDSYSIHTFERIPTLGAFGFNEYNANREVDQSQVNHNKFTPREYKSEPIVNSLATKAIFNGETANSIIKKLFENTYKDKDGNDIPYDDTAKPYRAAFDLIKGFLPDFSNIDIKFGPLGAGASYTQDIDADGNPIGTITINEDILKGEYESDETDLQRIIMEELFHHVTRNTIDQFVEIEGFDDNGKLVYKPKVGLDGTPVSVPAPLISFLTAYNYAFQHYVNKYGITALNEKFENFNKIKNGDMNATPLVDDGTELGDAAYRLHNVHEFVAGLFIKDKDFAKELGKVKYLNTNKSLIHKLIESLANLFDRLLPKGSRKDSILAESVNSFIEFIEDYNKVTEKSQNILQRTRKLPGDENIRKAQNTLGMLERKKPRTGEETPPPTERPFVTQDMIADTFESTTMYSTDVTKGGANMFFADINAKIGLGTFEISAPDDEFTHLNSVNAVFAISTMIAPGTDGNNTNLYKVAGNTTGRNVEKAISLGKPVFVYDQNRNVWLTWNGENWERANEQYIKLTKNFLGIGTEELNDNGKQAIKALYRRTFGNPGRKGKRELPPNTDNTVSLNKTKVEVYENHWTRDEVAKQTDKIFLFGDNFEDAKTGYVPSKTQAVIRGLPNTIGISTKWDRDKNFTPKSKLKSVPVITKDTKKVVFTDSNNKENSGYRVRIEGSPDAEIYVTKSGKVWDVMIRKDDSSIVRLIGGYSTMKEAVNALPNFIAEKANSEKNIAVLNSVKINLDIEKAKASYLNDSDFDMFKEHVDMQIKKALDSGKTIVIPKDGIGTGAAKLETEAPKLFEYLNKKLEELKKLQSDAQQTEIPSLPASKPKDKKGKRILGDLGATMNFINPDNTDIKC